MLVLSGAATTYLLFESFQQTANARVARSEELVARACREIADRFNYSFRVGPVCGWSEKESARASASCRSGWNN